MFKLDLSRTESRRFFILESRDSYQVFLTSTFLVFCDLEETLASFSFKAEFVFLHSQLNIDDFRLRAVIGIFLDTVKVGVVKTEEGRPTSPGMMTADSLSISLMYLEGFVGGLGPLQDEPRQIQSLPQRIQNSELDILGRIKLPPGFWMQYLVR